MNYSIDNQTGDINRLVIDRVIPAIDSTITSNAVDVFLYDTKNDSDGGQKAKNVGLPPIMSIIAELNQVKIIDILDDSVLFTITGLTNVTTVDVSNGRLYVGGDFGVNEYNLFNDVELIKAYFTPTIISNSVNQVIATVLDNAPVDIATGLPIPTVYVATNGGLTRIASDGSVSSSNLGGNSLVKALNVVDDYIYMAHNSNTATVNLTVANINTSVDTIVHGTDLNSKWQYYTGTWNLYKTPIYYNNLLGIIKEASHNSIATNRSLTLIRPNTKEGGNGLHATITKDFNTGWQFGDIKGCFLANSKTLDRSYNNNPLVESGTVTESPVATGAELMAYSGFSATNYLSQAYNSDLDFGTGDFNIGFWIDYNVNVNNNFILERGSRIDLFITDTTLSFRINQTTILSYTSIIGTWISVVIARKDGVIKLCINGLEVDTAANTTDVSITDILLVGNRSIFDDHLNGSLALLKIGAGSPTAEQIKEIYETEKYLFQENAKCLLSGTSNDVVALDYDKTTDKTYAGTTTNLSVFKGLVRVEEENVAYTSISVENGIFAGETV